MKTTGVGSKPRRRKGEGSVKYDRKGNRWIGTVYVDGKPHYCSAPTEDAALAKLAVIRVQLAKGKEPKNSRESLGAYLDRWIKLKTNIESSTWRTYEGYIRNHIKPALGRIRLTELKPLQVQEFIRDRERAGLSPRTIEQIRAVLRKALTDAERWEIIDRNVAKLVELPSKQQKEIEPLTPTEAQTFLEAIEGHRLEALFMMALATGLRQGELLGLRWEYQEDRKTVRDVDLETGRLIVNYALARVDGKWILKRPKTPKSRRNLVLPTIVHQALVSHRDRQAFERATAAKARLEQGLAKSEQPTHWERWGLVFARSDGQPLVSKTVTIEFQKVLKKAELPRQRFQDLRHGAASLLIAQGATLQDVAEQLGHSQIGLVASTYGHLYDEQRRANARRMDEILRKKSDGQHNA